MKHLSLNKGLFRSDKRSKQRKFNLYIALGHAGTNSKRASCTFHPIICNHRTWLLYLSPYHLQPHCALFFNFNNITPKITMVTCEEFRRQMLIQIFHRYQPKYYHSLHRKVSIIWNARHRKASIIWNACQLTKCHIRGHNMKRPLARQMSNTIHPALIWNTPSKRK
jgi:hypothetical protein